ncbi:hypothetical protein [Salinarimonas soli]|uniref:Uncharacterized protein n=1 Tax=Salinarimonas soli TaxID=1638099 RepID=A0A5B2VYZ4_9HYPH|nr:hypothetical protein [Salinarimonas soli]KAA2244004.1 hypothetical protein F0L46_01785 [Salinarimonas soli]
MTRFLVLACALALMTKAALASPPPLAAVTLVGPPETVFSAKRDGCTPVDMPDAPVRAYRDRAGRVVVFGLHHENRALRGESLARLAIDCTLVLASGGRADPAAFDDMSWITATWTEDGRTVHALVHHEYQANRHPGRCRHKGYLQCWYNTILGVTSGNGGASFARPEVPRVVAGAPFGQEVEQGRHRGFFNPSNIVSDGPWRYVFIATTGWTGQPSGACLLRTRNPGDPGSWRAFNGTDYTVRYRDPYRGPGAPPGACKPVGPFPAPVGGVVRHRGTGAWIAVFQASRDGADFPEAGFYVTSSADLLRWDKPRLLLAGRTLYDDPCTSGPRLIAYPSLLDHEARSRNFEDVGDEAELYFTTLRVDGCEVTADRDLVRRRVAIKLWASP